MVVSLRTRPCPASFAGWPKSCRNDPAARVGLAAASCPASPGAALALRRTVPNSEGRGLPRFYGEPNRKAPPLLTGLCLRSRAARLLAGRAHIHVDFHSDRHFDDFWCFPGHLVLPFFQTKPLAIKDGCSPVKSFCGTRFAILSRTGSIQRLPACRISSVEPSWRAGTIPATLRNGWWRRALYTRVAKGPDLTAA